MEGLRSRTTKLKLADDRRAAAEKHGSATNTSSEHSPEHLTSMLALQFRAYMQTKDSRFISNMARTMEQAASDLDYGPQTTDIGVSEFMKADMGINDDEAVCLVQELKLASGINETKTVARRMQTIHKVLLKNNWHSKITFKGLGFFLGCTNHLITASEWNPDVVQISIEQALKMTELHVKHTTLWTVSTKDDEEDAAKADDLEVWACVLDIVKKCWRQSLPVPRELVDILEAVLEVNKRSGDQV